jgi:hypothetical protein
VIVGGQFEQLGQTERSNLAEVDARSGTPSRWDPSPSAPVRSIARSPGSVFVAGNFFRIAGETRPSFARLDASTGRIMANSPVMDDAVRRVLVHDGLLYTGESQDVRAYELTTGERKDWRLPFNFANAEALEFWRGRVYLGAEGLFGLYGSDGPDGAIPAVAPATADRSLPIRVSRTSASQWGIAFDLQTASMVQVDLYDLAGRRVARLADAPMSAGAHQLKWASGSREHAIPRGIYFVRLVAGAGRATAKVVVW